MSSVRKSRGILWSNNELHAHKKNVGEEARLLGDLDLIRRRMALSTSGIQVALTKVHSDLKEVRTSTGHSVDGLPPTPFRLRRLRRGQKRVSIQSSKELQSPRSPLPNHGILKRLFPATTPQQAQPYRRHLNTYQNVKDDTVKNVEYLSATENLFPMKGEQHLFNKEGGMNFKDHDGTLTNGDAHLPASVKLHRNASDISNPGKSERALSTSKSMLSLSPSTKRSVSDLIFNPPDYHSEELMELLPRISRMEVPNVGRNGRRVSVEFTLPDVSNLRRYPDLTEEEEVHPLKFKKTVVDGENRREGRELDREDSCVSSTSLRKEGLQQEKLKPVLKQQTSEDDNRRGSTTSVTPLGRELTEMIQSVREKNAELLAGQAAVVAINSKSTLREAQDQHQRDQDHLKLLKARSKAVPSKLPNTRYRCRTCEERLRDNTRYRQSLKKHQEQKAATTHSGTGSCKHRTNVDKIPKLPAKDLDGNVINAQGMLARDDTTVSKKSNQGGFRKYSMYGSGDTSFTTTQTDRKGPRNFGLDRAKTMQVTKRGHPLKKQLGFMRSNTTTSTSNDDNNSKQEIKSGLKKVPIVGGKTSKKEQGVGFKHKPKPGLLQRPAEVWQATDSDTEDEDVDIRDLEKIPRPHYSRSRMDQLAEPRGGRKARLNISGSVLRRQAEALRRPHDKNQLTEREQERLLRLQSRVRLFVAVLQERQMPHGMVHIPQRDDIMRVDISHLG